MLWTLFVVLLTLWAIGVIGSFTMGGFLHVLLALALVTLFIQVLTTTAPDMEISGRSFMDQDRIEGKTKDISGRIERQAGEWTGDGELQVDGARRQAEGKVQDAWGKVKDAGRDLKRDAKRELDDRRKKDRKAA